MIEPHRLHFLIPNPPAPAFEDYCADRWPASAAREGHVMRHPSTAPKNAISPTTRGIIKRLKAGQPGHVIAKAMNVSPSYVCKIKRTL